MKRFHVHVSVNDLARSIRFYTVIASSDAGGKLVNRSMRRRSAE